jgi:mRNA interferase MazF
MAATEPKRGEVWDVDLNPTVGSEMQKVRRCVVISSNSAGVLPLRIVVPLTGWQMGFAARFWLVRIDPDSGNGITKPDAADVLQVRSVDVSRFDPYGRSVLGVVSPEDLRRICAAVALTIGHHT